MAAPTGAGRPGPTTASSPSWWYSESSAPGPAGTAASARSTRRRHRRRRSARSGTRDTRWTSAASFSRPSPTPRIPEGITTGNGDGIIHIHPTAKAAAGKNATLGKFADAVGMKLNAAELQMPGGKLYQDGDTCQGKASHVYVKQFAFVGDTTGTLQNVDPRNVLLQDQSLLTIAFVPASDKNSIPPPPAYVNTNLNKLAATSPTPTTTVPGSTGTSGEHDPDDRRRRPRPR